MLSFNNHRTQANGDFHAYLESHVLQKVSCAIGALGFESTSSVNPNTNLYLKFINAFLASKITQNFLF